MRWPITRGSGKRRCPRRSPGRPAWRHCAAGDITSELACSTWPPSGGLFYGCRRGTVGRCRRGCDGQGGSPAGGPYDSDTLRSTARAPCRGTRPAPRQCPRGAAGGALHVGCQGLAWEAEHFAGTPVHQVSGNHEVYGACMATLRAELARPFDGRRVVISHHAPWPTASRRTIAGIPCRRPLALGSRG